MSGVKSQIQTYGSTCAHIIEICDVNYVTLKRSFPGNQKSEAVVEYLTHTYPYHVIIFGMFGTHRVHQEPYA